MTGECNQSMAPFIVILKCQSLSIYEHEALRQHFVAIRQSSQTLPCTMLTELQSFQSWLRCNAL